VAVLSEPLRRFFRLLLPACAATIASALDHLAHPSTGDQAKLWQWQLPKQQGRPLALPGARQGAHDNSWIQTCMRGR
jgi:hypothetical protein